MGDMYYRIDGSWRGRLMILARPRGGDWLEDEVANWARLGLDVVVSLLTDDEVSELGLTNEEKVCHLKGIRFERLPIPDSETPRSSEEVLKLVGGLEGKLEEGATVGIHCRQGIGRSGLLAACLLVSNGSSPGDAFERLSHARGCPVPETEEQRQWVEAFAPELVKNRA